MFGDSPLSALKLPISICLPAACSVSEVGKVNQGPEDTAIAWRCPLCLGAVLSRRAVELYVIQVILLNLAQINVKREKSFGSGIESFGFTNVFHTRQTNYSSSLYSGHLRSN